MKPLLLSILACSAAFGQFSNATRIQGRYISPTAPTNGYVLTWNSSASQWEPAVSGAGGSPGGTTGQIQYNAGSGTFGGFTMIGDVHVDTSTGISEIQGGSIVDNMIANGTIDLNAKVQGILAAPNGGTSNAFFAVGGPASTVKTFTFPNANATICYTGNCLPLAGGTMTGQIVTRAGTTAAGTAPIKLVSGPLNTSPEAGAVEFLTDAFYGTITTGVARKTFAFLESPTFTTPNIGAATGTSLVLTGSITSGSGSGVGGAVDLTQGTLPSIVANTVSIVAPTSVTGYEIVMPGAASTGIPHRSNSANVVTESVGLIVNADITNSTIDLTSKVTGVLPNANTTAASANTASAIVARDGSGNFTAGTITAALTGTASGNLVSGGALGTPSSATLTNATGLPAAGVVGTALTLAGGTLTGQLVARAGATGAGTAPIKLQSGSLNTTAEAGAIEFLTDAYYGTITTGAARKTFAFLESPTFTGTITGANLTVCSTCFMAFGSRGGMQAIADGSFSMNATGGSGFTRIQFGNFAASANSPALTTTVQANPILRITDGNGGATAVFGVSNFATVSVLPSCGAATKGTYAAVLDATAPAVGVAVTGGGSAWAGVNCNGSAWNVNAI